MNPSLPRTPIMALAGAASGALYALWLRFGTNSLGSLGSAGSALDDLSHNAGAGVFYAVIVGAVLQNALKFEAWRWALWVVAAGVSYAAAFNLAVRLYEPNQDWVLVNFLAGGAAGVVGAALLSAASAALFPALRHGRMVLIGAVAGGIVGLALALVLQADTLLAWIAFFAIWQAVYAVGSTRA